MKYEVEITLQAEKDLRGIYEYIAFQLLAPENAIRQLNLLEKNIMGLQMLPFRYRKYESEPWQSRGLHIMPVDHFVVLYIPNEETKIVTVLRVMHARRDVDRQLQHDNGK